MIPTIWDELAYLWKQEVKLKGGIINTVLMKDEYGTTQWAALFMVYGLPLISVAIFYYMMKSAFSTNGDTMAEVRAIEAKNERTKQRMRQWLNDHPNYKRKVRKWE